MNNEQFNSIKHIIKSRRTVSWAKMNSKLIPDETIMELLELAHWAPTHGKTEPWQFFVYSGAAMKQFAADHADLYWNNTPEDKRMEGTWEKLARNTDKASHLIIAVMKRGNNEKIPQVEEIAAASAAVQNILLGAAALDISALWSTGGMAHKPALAQYLGLGKDDMVMGLLFLGYTDEPARQGSRTTHVSEKITWNNEAINGK